MSSFVPRASAPTLAEPDPTKHVKYTLGMVLGVDDFTQEFAYLAGRDQWLARDLIGYGTASGLRVGVEVEDSAPQVLVTPGVAVSPRGQLIRVAPAQCADLNQWLTARREELGRRLGPAPGLRAQLRLYVVLCYRDCATDMVPIPGEPCRSQEETVAPSRLADDFKLELRFESPGQTEEDALRDFVEWLGQVEVTEEPGSFATLEELERAIRDAARLQSAPVSSPPDFLYGSPPEALRIHPSMAYEYLRAAFRLWTTELRPRWRAGHDAGRDSLARPGDRGDDDCVMLAELSFAVARANNFALWQVEDPAAVAVHEERRPYLLHLRMLQELIISGRHAAGSGGGPAFGPAFNVVAETSFGQAPNAGKGFDYARADHTHGTPPPPTLGGDVTGPVASATVAAIRNREVDQAAPAEDQVLTFKGGKWRPAPPPAAAAGAIPKPGAAVTPETGFNQPPKAGTSADYARADHSHGTPPLPTLGGDVAGAANVAKVVAIQNVPVDTTRPTANQVLAFDAATSRWKPAAPQAAAASDAVTRPAGRPAYRIVAAGVLPALAGRGQNTFNNLRVTRVTDGGLVTLTFDGYEPPARTEPRHQYVVKALPVVPLDSQINAPVVAFLSFDAAATGFTLLVTQGGQPLDASSLTLVSLMVEVSQFDVAAAKAKEKDTKEAKDTKEGKESKEKDTKEAKEKDTKEGKDAKEKDTKESKEKDTKEGKDAKEKDTKETKEKDTKETKEKDSKETKEKDTKDTKEASKDTKESKESKESKENKEEKEEKEQKDRTKEVMSLKEKDRDVEPAPASRPQPFTASAATLSVAGLDAEAEEVGPEARAFIREGERPAVGRRAIELADKADDKQPEGGPVEKQGEAVN